MVAVFNLADIVEIAVLLLVTYVSGCALGYGLRRLAWALRTPLMVRAPQPALAPAVVLPAARPTPAARLAMAATAEEIAPIVAAPIARQAPPAPHDSRPGSLPSPRGGIGDDLRQIKGIGPKIEVFLHELGVFHYDQIAAWTGANAEWVDLKLGFKGRIARERWIVQAEALAKSAGEASKRVA